MKTQAEIDAIAERIRASGTPDFLNRWIGQTPESITESEAKVAIQVDRNRRSETMPRAVGPKEQALQKLRGNEAADQENDVKTKKKSTATAPAKAPKAAATKAAPVPEKPVGTAVRSGSKVEIIKKLLARKNGCTSKEVQAACGWPSVSMPQQSKAAGVELFKKKEEGQPTRYADHALT